MRQFSLSLLKCLLVGLGLQSTLFAAPANDSFSATAVVTGFPTNATGSNIDATLEFNESLPTAYTIEPFQPAEASVWFTWTSPVTGSVQIDTLGSDFDTILAVWTGSTLATLNEIDSNDYYDGLQGAIFIDVVQGTTYRISVYGYRDARGQINLNIKNDSTSRISGIVTGPDGTTPLAGIDASAYYKIGEGSSASWQFIHYGVTRSDGSYTIRGLKSDTYRVGFADYETGSYQSEYYDNTASVESGTDIVVATNATVLGIHASLELASKITGTVTGLDGTTPLPDIYVSAYQFNSASSDWDFASSTITRPDGTYGLGSLVPGTYRVEFGYFAGDYFPEYYDNAPDLASATSITVAANTTISGINASLASGSRITGTVTGPDGTTPLAGIGVIAYRFNSIFGFWSFEKSTTTQPDGSYRIGALVAGSYRIEFRDDDGNFISEYYDDAVSRDSAAEIAVATNTTVTGINASLAVGAFIAGIVTGPDGIIPLADVEVTAYQLNTSTPVPFWEQVEFDLTEADGSYKLGGMRPGAYRIGFSKFGSEYISEYFDNAIDPASATDVVVISATTVTGINASLATGSKITGNVTGSNGITPLPGISVSAYRFNSSTNSWEFRNGASTQQDGSYQLKALSPGSYQIRFDDFTGDYFDEYYDNAADLASATSITLGTNATVSGINAALAAASKITGTVTGPNGSTPLAGIEVRLHRFNNNPTPVPRWEVIDLTFTQSDGSYRFGALAAGSYRIGFSDANGNYITEFYHDALNVDSATDVPVPVGASIDGIDASLVLPTSPEILNFRKIGPTSFEMSFTGTPGNLYWLQESTALTTWKNVGTPFTCQHGVNVRSLSSSEPKIFWRVKTFP